MEWLIAAGAVWYFLIRGKGGAAPAVSALAPPGTIANQNQTAAPGAAPAPAPRYLPSDPGVLPELPLDAGIIRPIMRFLPPSPVTAQPPAYVAGIPPITGTIGYPVEAPAPNVPTNVGSPLPPGFLPMPAPLTLPEIKALGAAQMAKPPAVPNKLWGVTYSE